MKIEDQMQWTNSLAISQKWQAASEDHHHHMVMFYFGSMLKFGTNI